MIIMPVRPGIADQRYKITLDGVEFVVRLTWSGRLDSWYFSLFTSDEEPIHTRIRLVCGFRLLQTDASEERPPGDFYVLSKDSQTYDGSSDIGLDDLGEYFGFYYFTQAEIEALRVEDAAAEEFTVSDYP